jgi:hypothetical protein
MGWSISRRMAFSSRALDVIATSPVGLACTEPSLANKYMSFDVAVRRYRARVRAA